MRKLLAILTLSSLLLAACSTAPGTDVPTNPNASNFQQAAAAKIAAVQVTQADLKDQFADYTLKTTPKSERYGLGGLEIDLLQGEEEVFQLRYMTLASEEALLANFTDIGTASDMVAVTDFGDAALLAEGRKKITFRKDGVKMDVTINQSLAAAHSVDEIKALAELMLSKF